MTLQELIAWAQSDGIAADIPAVKEAIRRHLGGELPKPKCFNCESEEVPFFPIDANAHLCAMCWTDK